MPPPLQNNVANEEEIEEEEFFEDLDKDMNYFGEQLTEGFVTEEYFLNSEYYDADVFETKNDLNLEVTTVTADTYQTNPNKNLNLRSGPNQVVQNPKKKIVVPTKQQSDPMLEKNSNKPVQEVDRNPNNPNQFRRHFVPRFIPRERRNNDIQRERREIEDQKVPPPL